MTLLLKQSDSVSEFVLWVHVDLYYELNRCNMEDY